jgi:hypothetical protein
VRLSHDEPADLAPYVRVCLGATMAQAFESTSYAPPTPFLGTWTYRSFINNAEIATDFNNLEFGRGELIVEHFPLGSFRGRLIFGDTYQFRLMGASSFGNPFTVRFQGVGDTTDSLGQIYDYVGYLVPVWPNGVDQVPAIVGSVVRTVPHDGGQAKAGVVSSWIALKTS